MKDSKFIELLNLYVDHQISAADAALLETEIQKNPERRKVYRQYCQMQKACVTLAENFRAEAPVESKVIEMSPAPSRMVFATYAMGFAAAAACVALVWVNRPAGGVRSGLATPQVVAETTDVTVETSALIASTPHPVASRTVLHPVFPGVLRQDSRSAAVVAQADQVPLDWMNQVQLERVPVETLWFNSAPTLQTRDLTLRSVQPYQGQVESTAFILTK